MTENEKTPKGIIMLFIHEGRVVAHAADFDVSRPGGFTIKEAQENRARDRLSHAVIRACCSELISKSLGSYECRSIMAKLPGIVQQIQIGYDDE